MNKGDFIDVVVMVYLWITTVVLLGATGSVYTINKVFACVLFAICSVSASLCIYWSIKIGSRYNKRRKK